MRRNDTRKNYLAIRNLYRLTPNLTWRDSPRPMTLWCHFCGVSRYGTYVACLAVWDLSEETNRQIVNADGCFGVRSDHGYPERTE
jgi:hypothetical protein